VADGLGVDGGAADDPELLRCALAGEEGVEVLDRLEPGSDAVRRAGEHDVLSVGHRSGELVIGRTTHEHGPVDGELAEMGHVPGEPPGDPGVGREAALLVDGGDEPDHEAPVSWPPQANNRRCQFEGIASADRRWSQPVEAGTEEGGGGVHRVG